MLGATTAGRFVIQLSATWLGVVWPWPPTTLKKGYAMSDLDPDVVRASMTGDLLVDAYVEPDWESFLTTVAASAVPECWAAVCCPP